MKKQSDIYDTRSNTAKMESKYQQNTNANQYRHRDYYEYGTDIKHDTTISNKSRGQTPRNEREMTKIESKYNSGLKNETTKTYESSNTYSTFGSGRKSSQHEFENYGNNIFNSN